jgi:hypothetical protein
MFNEDYKLLVTILNKIGEIKEIGNTFSSREEFACNDNNIHLGVGFINELTNITSKISAITILASTYLTKELPLLNRYKECIFNKDNSINAYKLYDFLTLELDTIQKELKDLLTK